MKRTTLIKELDRWDRAHRRVFTLNDLRKMFPDGTDAAFSVRIRKLAAEEKPILKKACRGVYVNMLSRLPYTNLLEEIARTVRRGRHSYISMESALSEYGRISQIPIRRITAVTTGRGGTFNTSFGTIEFSHTGRDPEEFLDRLIDTGRPLRIASEDLAEEDLIRNGRNTHMLIPKEPEIEAEEDIFDAQF